MSLDDEIEMAEHHANGLECAIRGENMAARPATDLLTTLHYALGCVQAHITAMRRERDMVR